MHVDASQSVGLLWMSDQLVAETSQETDIHAAGGIRTQQASGRRPTYALDRGNKCISDCVIGSGRPN